jgi:hypothetical protein
VRRVSVHLVAVVALGVFAGQASAASPAIEWSMPDRLGVDLDKDGLVDYANSAEEFEQAEDGFAVDLRVRAGLCRDESIYAWHSAAGDVVEQGREGCQVRQRFAREGTYRVSVEIRDAGGRVESYSRKVVVQDWLVVSIGDSVASGEGNPDVGGFIRKARWQSARCHRSALASPAKAALALELGDPHTSTTFVHLACSGAKVSLGLLRPYKGIDPPDEATPLPPQVKELERIDSVREIDAVMVSIGANDVYFGPMVGFCIGKRNCVKAIFNPKDPENPIPGEGQPLEGVVEGALGRLDDRYGELAGRLSQVVEPKRTLIVDYFDPTHDEDGQTCKRIGLFDPIFGLGQIDRGEAEWAFDKLLTPLNEEIGKVAARAGWTEVTGVAEAFLTHGYCAKDPWVRHLGGSLRRQRGNGLFSRVAGLLHPNEDGHAGTALLLGGALQRVLGEAEGPPAGGEGGGEIPVTRLAAALRQAEEIPESEGEGDTERMALILIPIAAIFAMLVVAWLLRVLGRRFPPPEPADLQPETAGGGPPAELPEGDTLEAFGAMLEAGDEGNPKHWVHRRVESIEILDERMVRRRVSVDFTPESPNGAPSIAPIAMLEKGTLTRFDLRDEAGASIPLLTREQNAAFSLAHMLAIAEEAAEGDPLPDELVSWCWKIASGEPHEAELAIFEIATELEPVPLRKSARFRSFTTTFARSFPVIVSIEDAPRRRVVKLAYNEVVSARPTRMQRLGIDPILAKVRIPELGDASSRHIEFLRADGLDAFNAQLLGEAPDESLIAIEASVEGGEPHLAVVNAPRGSYGVAALTVRASRTGILVGGPLLATLSAAALTAAWFALPQLAGETAGGAASILLAVPAALGAYLGARRPHPLEAALLSGARALVFLSGMLAFLGAGALALDSSAEPLRIMLGAVALLSWLPVAGLVLTYFLPRGPPPGHRGWVL